VDGRRIVGGDGVVRVNVGQFSAYVDFVAAAAAWEKGTKID